VITQKVAFQLNSSVDRINHLQKDAIKNIARILFAREQEVRQARGQTLERALPPRSYSRLFGLETAITRLVDTLLDPDAAKIVNLVGMGGIGKTALADAVARQVIYAFCFDRVVWVRLENLAMGEAQAPELVYQALLTQLAAALSPDGNAAADPEKLVRHTLHSPHLIVIDNVENQAEALYILEQLRTYAPTRFLMTSREHTPGPMEVFTFPVTELAPADAAALIRHHAQTTGVTDLASASQEVCDSIYGVTGGNPLAIKLVVSLAALLSLPQILGDFTDTQPVQTEALYRRIYLRAWGTLSPQAKALLQAMPLVSEDGAFPEQLQAISGLSSPHLWQALAELTARALLEVGGTLHERLYSIHPLTRSFLQTEINRWQG
jgi:hypothetical protein